MDGLAMLREIIAHLRNLFDLPASSPDLHQNLHQILHLPSHQPLIVHPHLTTTTTTTTCVWSAMEATTGEWWCSARTNQQPNQQPAAATLSSPSSSVEESLPPSSSSSSSSSSSTLHPFKKQRSSETKAPCTTMKEEIWKHLPEDLIQQVKSHLPIPALFRSRLVSQKWNSSELPPRPNAPPHKETWVYAVTGMESTPRGWLYEPSSKKWRLRTIPNFKNLIPVASASGLVCFLNRDDNRVYVCNPLTGKSRRLNISGGRLACPVAFGMYSKKGEEYCVIWVGGDGRFGVYESEKEGWGREMVRGGENNVSIPVWLGVRSGSVRVGGEVYFLRRGPEGVVSYNVERGEWRDHLIPAPANVTDRALGLKAGGEEEEEGLLLVGLQKKNAATCVCVWELQRMCYLWKEVDRMPNLWCLDFYGKNVRMVCLANSSLILLSLTSASTHRLVSYDTVACLWSQLPSPAFSPFTSGAAFRPSPSALP